MKRFLSVLLAMVLALSLFAPAMAEEKTYNMPEMNTTDPITLTFMLWDDFELVRALADKFTEKYPNITVELRYTTTDTVNADLTNQAANKDLPDIYFWLDLDPLLANPWMADITEYVENDPEVQNLYPSLQRVGYVDGKRCYFMCGEFLPAVMFLDKTVFDKLNVEMPPQDWKWDDLINVIETMSDPTQGVWAYNYFMGTVTCGPLALTDNALGEFGWNGESYDFTSWAELQAREADWRRLGNQALQGSEEYLAVVPSNMWPGEAGVVAMQMDAWWTLNNIYMKTAALERGLQMVPYVQPVGEGVENPSQFAWLDMVSISSTCEHPREAYELMKYICWGKEGWLERIELWPTIMYESGSPIYPIANCLPMLQDEELQAAMLTVLPDLGYWNDWEGFLANITSPATFGARTIPGFNTFINDYYHNSDFNGVIGIHNAVFQGAVDAYDYIETLNAKGREYYDAAIKSFTAIYGVTE